MTFPIELHVVRLRQSRHPESGSFPQGKAFHLGMSLCPADDDEYVEVEIEPEMEAEIPQPATPPATHTTLEAVAENRPEVPNPFMMQGPATFPCPQCQAECFVGQHHCLRCRHQLAEIRGEDRRFIKTAQRRNRILDQLSSAGVTVQSNQRLRARQTGKAHKGRRKGSNVLRGPHYPQCQWTRSSAPSR